MLVALTEKSFLSNVYGKSASSVMFILVFRVGLADDGVTRRPAFVVDMVVRLRELPTV